MVFIFLIEINFCYAVTYKATITENGVNLRSGPGTNHKVLKTVNKDAEYSMIDNILYKDEVGCEKGWYKIYYDASAIGYVCSNYVTTKEVIINKTPTSECEIALNELKFPPSYWPGLCTLKEKHPTWEFKPIFTGLEWVDAVNSESACGISYIASNVETNIDKTCNNPYTNTWYPASSSAVAYYMDPRNWFTEKTIFQFEYLSYDNALKDSYSKDVNSIITNTEFYKYHSNLGNNLGDIINISGINTNVSPIFIASRILNELGRKNTLYNLYSGVYEELEGIYKGYYNFYNFGVSDSCVAEKGTTICGLEYALKKDWKGLNKAIEGGVRQIADSYIAKGQYSIYLQKFNVVPTQSNRLYNHQYMTNIKAPSSEAKSIYNSYKENNNLETNFSFYIPIYNNMDDSSYIEYSGPSDIPEDRIKSDLDISTIITGSGYKYSPSNINGIKKDTKIETLKSNIENIAGSGNVTITNKNDVLITDGLVATGYKVKVKNNKSEEVLNVILYGDTSGEGDINALDLLQIQKYILGTYNFEETYKLAADTSKDNVINALDLLQVQKNILGTYEIEQ